MATWHCYLQQLQDSAKKRHYCIVTNTSLGKFLADVMEGNKDNLLQFLVKKIYFFERVAERGFFHLQFTLQMAALTRAGPD